MANNYFSPVILENTIANISVIVFMSLGSGLLVNAAIADTHKKHDIKLVLQITADGQQ